MALTPKQIRFCEEYLIDLNGTQAAIRAGYSKKTANEQAARLLANVSLQDYVQQLQSKTSDKLEITREKVIAEYARIAFSDVRAFFGEDGGMKNLSDLTSNEAAAISSIETEELFEGFGKDRERIGRTRKVKMWDKTKALESLGKHLGLFEKDNEQKRTEQQPFSDQQVEKIIDVLKGKKS